MGNLKNEMVDRWLKLANYLSDEKLEGKTHFTLSFQDGCNFIVHPEGKNGKTLDLSICIQLETDDRVNIKIDGNNYLVKPIISFSQLKRLIGADNSYYTIECVNRPERWKDKVVAENEMIDLNQPDCKNLEFKCVRKKNI